MKKIYVAVGALALYGFTTLPNSAHAETSVIPPADCFPNTEVLAYSADHNWVNVADKNSSVMDAVTVATLNGLNDQIAEFDKRLLLVFPPKPSFYMPSEVAAEFGVNVGRLRSDYVSSMGLLKATGLMVLDSVTDLQRYEAQFPLQRTADHHWTSEGAVLTAYEAAALLTGERTLDSSDVADFLYEHRGEDVDVLEPAIWRAYANADCDLSLYSITDKNYVFDNSDSSDLDSLLFGDVDEKIALFGTSFSNEVQNLFERSLAHFTDTQVIGYQTRGGSAASSLALNIRDVLLDESISSIVWENNEVNDYRRTLGAASLGWGLITGSCGSSDLLYAVDNQNLSFGEWHDISSAIGRVNTFDIDVPLDIRVNFRFNFVDMDGNDISSEGFVAVRGAADETAPYDKWVFRIPSSFEDAEAPMSLNGVSVMLSEFDGGVEDEDASFPARIASCLKLSHQNYAVAL